MKVGGGLNYVTGPMGSGKSLYGSRAIAQAVCSDRYAVTNVRLGHWEGREFVPGDGWADVVARHVSPLGLRRRRAAIAAKLRSLYVFETDLSEAMRYRVPGRGEARAVFVWDETHNDLNNRDWRAEGRAQVLEWGTQLRKLGFVGFLLSQHADNTDAALRRVCNWQVRLQNQKEQTRLLGMRVTPVPLFLAHWYATNIPAGSRMKAEKVERYFLSWHKRIYDTHDLYHGLAGDVEDGLIMLPEIGARSWRQPAQGSAALARVVPSPSPASDALGRIALVVERSREGGRTGAADVAAGSSGADGRPPVDGQRGALPAVGQSFSAYGEPLGGAAVTAQSPSWEPQSRPEGPTPQRSGGVDGGGQGGSVAVEAAPRWEPNLT